MHRRQFLGGLAALAASQWVASGSAARAVTAPARPGPSPYGPLSAQPDAQGLLLPPGFIGRVVARSEEPVPGTTYVWHPFPDGGACFPMPDGGWAYASNSENPFPVDGTITSPAFDVGKVSVIRFGPDGTITGAYSVLEGTRSNCAGGTTPWGTWLSAEEFDLASDTIGPGRRAGQVWECDPTGAKPARVLPDMGSFRHEAVAVDPDGRRCYLTEDRPNGRFYRFTPAAWPDLATGMLEVAIVGDDGSVTWHTVADPSAATTPTRAQVPGATVFDGGEGCFFAAGVVYVTTKGDNRVWAYDVAAQSMTVVYDATAHPDPPLTGVDNIVVSSAGDLYVAEDGGNMEVVVITADGVVAPVVRATGPEHGAPNPTVFPTQSEISGLSFSPDGSRLYFNSQRGGARGITYEVTGPFRGAAAPATAAPPPTSPGDVLRRATGGQPGDGGVLPASGLDEPLGLAGLGALGAAAAALALRARGARPDAVSPPEGEPGSPPR